MANPRLMKTMPFPATTAIIVLVAALLATTAKGLVPYTRPLLWDLMVPAEDPFRILEQTPLTIPTSTPKGLEALALMARADWKETSTSHVIKLDIPGMRRDDIKIEVEENRVLRISGERKTEEEEEVEGERWHRAERTGGKFWRQFRLPANADLDHIKAHLQDGVLQITVPKLAEEKRQPKVVNISGQDSSSSAGQDIKATKVDIQ